MPEAEAEDASIAIVPALVVRDNLRGEGEGGNVSYIGTPVIRTPSNMDTLITTATPPLHETSFKMEYGI